MPFANGETVRTNGKKNSNGHRKPILLVPPDIRTVQGAVHALPAANSMAAYEADNKVISALAQDGDPAKLLADVREVLFGPTRKLQEARLEELVAILEGLDRESQTTHEMFRQQFKQIDITHDQHAKIMESANQLIDENAKTFDRDINTINKRLDDVSDSLIAELRRVEQNHKNELEEQAAEFEAKLDQLSNMVAKQFEDMANHHKQAMHAMATDFSSQMRELAIQTKATDDRIIGQVEARFAQAEANADDEKRRNIKVLSEGFNHLSERLLTL